MLFKYSIHFPKNSIWGSDGIAEQQTNVPTQNNLKSKIKYSIHLCEGSKNLLTQEK